MFLRLSNLVYSDSNDKMYPQATQILVGKYKRLNNNFQDRTLVHEFMMSPITMEAASSPYADFWVLTVFPILETWPCQPHTVDCKSLSAHESLRWLKLDAQLHISWFACCGKLLVRVTSISPICSKLSSVSLASVHAVLPFSIIARLLSAVCNGAKQCAPPAREPQYSTLACTG